MILGTVESCLRYPVKSFQGLEVSTITVQATGVVGDRERRNAQKRTSQQDDLGQSIGIDRDDLPNANHPEP